MIFLILILKAMRTKQVRPEKMEFEFELFIEKAYDKIADKEFIRFKFITTKIFKNFIYKINITPKILLEKKIIEFLIEGLSAPVISLARSGHAAYEFKFYDFRNTIYELRLLKQNLEKNNYKLKISKQGLKIIRQPSKKFLKITIL